MGVLTGLELLILTRRKTPQRILSATAPIINSCHFHIAALPKSNEPPKTRPRTLLRVPHKAPVGA